jgi:hypothetical protein
MTQTYHILYGLHEINPVSEKATWMTSVTFLKQISHCALTLCRGIYWTALGFFHSIYMYGLYFYDWEVTRGKCRNAMNKMNDNNEYNDVWVIRILIEHEVIDKVGCNEEFRIYL